VWLTTLHPAARTIGATTVASEVSVGRFLLGFIIAIVLVIFLAVQCTRVIF
jgi:hypothetical protein